MKRYIKITNQGTTPRDFLKIIGVGGKDDRAGDNSVFGQFKSGYKIASIIALRRGLTIAASSTDDEGRYALTYITQSKTIKHNGKEIIIQKICYWHSDGKDEWIEESSFALEAFPKWLDAAGDDNSETYPILRELIANARDEDKDFRCETGIERLQMAPPGQTVVYMEETNDALRVLGPDVDRYFKFFGASPLFEVSGVGAIYPKSAPNEIRFFNRGYLIGCRKHDELFHTSCFDYDIFAGDLLSEEKVLREKDKGKYSSHLAHVFLSIRDKDLLRQMIESAFESSSYELEIIRFANCAGNLPADFAALCREIWVEKFGPKAILSSDNVNHNNEAANLLQFSVINLYDSLKNFFKKAGIEDVSQKIASFNRGLKECSPTSSEQEKIDRIRATYLDGHLYYRELAEKYPVTVLLDESGVAAGVALDYNRCAITETVIAKSDAEFLLSLVHELRHCATKFHDTNYRGLINRADWEIVQLLQTAVLDKNEIAKLKDRIKELEKRVNLLGIIRGNK